MTSGVSVSPILEPAPDLIHELAPLLRRRTVGAVMRDIVARDAPAGQGAQHALDDASRRIAHDKSRQAIAAIGADGREPLYVGELGLRDAIGGQFEADARQ